MIYNSSKGIRYLTEEFVKNTTKQDRLDRIKNINLSRSKNENQIKYIENIDSLSNLNVLILNFNIIEKIEKLDKLINLKELYLKGNKLTKLEGIECLMKLKILDVSDNKISSFPYWLTRRCKYLKEIDISNNCFDSMEEITKLSPLKDLVTINASGNAVTVLTHYRFCVIVRLKFLQALDSKNITNEERREAIEKFEENDFDKVTAKLIEKEKEFEQIKEKQEKLEEEHYRQTNYQKDLNKKQKDYISKIKSLEMEVKNKDSLLKKKSEDLFKTCQKYYELEQDIAFIKIDAKFDILNQNLGSLDAPDDISEHSVTGTGDHAYMGKGQFITTKEAQMLQHKRRMRQQGGMTNGSDNGGRNSQDIKNELLNSLDDRIKEKMTELEEVNKNIVEKSKKLEDIKRTTSRTETSPSRLAMFGDFDRSKMALPMLSRFSPLRVSIDRIKKKDSHNSSPLNITDQFLEKIEHLTVMQKEADELRQQMEATEKITARQKEDVEYLRKEYEKMKVADPTLAHQIETEMQDKKFVVDQNNKLYQELSSRLDQLSLAIEQAMEDIKEIEGQLIEENQLFTEKMKEDIGSALQQLSKSLPSNVQMDQKKWIDAYKEADRAREDFQRRCSDQNEEIDHLKLQLKGLVEDNDRVKKAKRPLDGEVLVLRQDLDRLKEDALVAKDDLESEIEMEKCRNDELVKRIEEMQSNEYELQEQLELMSERCRQTLEQVNIEQFNMRNTLEQSIAEINEDVVQRINNAISNPSIISKSLDPVDLALSQLVKSTEKSNYERNEVVSPEIKRTTKHPPLKEHLDDVDGSTKLDDGKRKTYSMENVPKKHITVKKLLRKPGKRTMQNALAETCKEYEDDMSDVKDQIDNLADTIQDFRAHQRKKTKRKNSTPRMSFSRRRSEELSEEEVTSDGYTPRFKSRAYSQDRVSKKKPRHTSSDFRKWKSVEQDVSLEDDLLDEIENELGDLRRQVSSAGSRSTQKFEDALNYINELEMELQRRDEENELQGARDIRERGKRVSDENLKQTMSEVAKCQEDIINLHKRLNIKPSFTDDMASSEFDINKLKTVLGAQRTEIERLNVMLERLTTQGNPPTAVFPTSVPISQTQFFATDLKPNQMFSSVPSQNYFNSQSTPLLNGGRFLSTGVKISSGSESHLFCNVPEHHKLEDYINVRTGSHSSLKMKNKIKSESLRYIDTLERLKLELNKRNEELDDVEIKVSKQNGEMERLNYQINQLNMAKEDLLQQLSSLRQETDNVTRETINSTSETLSQMRAKKSHLNEEISKLTATINSRRDELIHLEREVHASRNQLSQVQADTSETFRCYEETRASHRRLILECEQLEKRSNEASLELANGMHDLDKIKAEISTLVSNRGNLEGIISKTQEIVNQKDEEYQKITDDVNKAVKRLNSLQSDLNMMTEEHRDKMQMISEGDQLLGDTRMELNHLKKEIEANQQYLDKMENEMGEKSVAIELARGELERTKQINQRSIQEYQTEQTRLKREIMDLKSSVSDCQTERNDLLNDIESLKLKTAQIKDNIERQEQVLQSHKSEVDRRSWQLQHSDNMLKMKQGQLQQLSLEYNERLLDVERLHEEVHQQELESKRIDSDIKRKSVEVEKIRQTIALEHENQLRLQFDKDNLESSVTNLTKERNMLQNQTKELEMELKNVKKQETQNHESLLSLESRLSQVRSDYEKMCSDKCSETIKRDELKLQTNNMAKQLHESKCELQSMRERLGMLDSQCDERTTEIRKKMQLQNNLNIEIRKLQDQIRMVNMSFEEANNQEHNKKDKLSGLDIEISRKEDELKNLQRKKDDIQNEIFKDEKKLEKIIKNSSCELNILKNELSEKLDNLEVTGTRLQQIRKDVAIKEFTEQKIIELEQIIRQHESTISQYEQETRKLSNHISVLSKDITSLQENHQFEIENKNKEVSKLRKRISREIFQLEKLAEDQCQRANSLAEDLSQARRDYMLLRNRILIYGQLFNAESTSLAQEHFIEQQNLFKEYLQPSSLRSELPQTVETAMLTEHRRHLQNQFTLLRDNIISAANTTVDSLDQKIEDNSYKFNKGFIIDRKWYNTSSSGLGSTLEHNASDTSPENEQAKRGLHNQFDEEIEIMHNENEKSNDLCRQLRGEVNYLKAGLATDKSTSMSTD